MPRGHGIRRYCRHCDMVDEYRNERWRQEDELENTWPIDENAKPAITFKLWLIHYPWPREA